MSRIRKVIAFVSVLFALIAIGGILSYIILWRVVNFPDDTEIHNQIEIWILSLSLIVNALLTISIIVIYVFQSFTIQREVEVLSEQHKIVKESHRPQITDPYDVGFFGEQDHEESIEFDSGGRWLNTIPKNTKVDLSLSRDENSMSLSADVLDQPLQSDYFDPEDNVVRFKLANAGGGLARNFRLFSHLTVYGTDELKGGAARSSLKRLDRKSLHAYSDNTMQSGEEDIEFEGEIKLSIKDLSGELITGSTYEFTEGMRYLSERNCEEIMITLELRYEDMFEYEYEEQFYHIEGKVKPDMDLNDVILSETPEKTFINTGLEQEKQNITGKLKNLIGKISDRISKFG